MFACLLLLLPWSQGHLIPRSIKYMVFSPSQLRTAASIWLLRDLIRSRRVEASTIREDIASSASKIPGFGPSNIVYPEYFEGLWDVDQEISDYIQSESSSSPTSMLAFIQAMGSFKGQHLQYQDRYLTYNNQVIQDRAFNMNAYSKVLFKEPYILAAWDISNPNLLTVSRSSGQITEFKVTKRSMESPPSDANTFAVGYSEYARVAQVEGSIQFGVPQLFGLRHLVRIRRDVDDSNTLRGVERIYLYKGDTLDLAADPLVTVKSRFTMTRAKTSL